MPCATQNVPLQSIAGATRGAISKSLRIRELWFDSPQGASAYVAKRHAKTRIGVSY